jgi:hypothetical protein
MHWLSLLLLLSSRGPSTDSSLVHALLKDIAGRQVSAAGFFRAGAFPSTRVHATRPGLIRPDNNIFFTGLIGLGLRDLQKDLQGPDKALCDSILERMQQAVPFYRNASGRLTYNFWQTDPPLIFPGDPLLRYLNRSHALPDDLDDTAILLLALERGDSAQVVKSLMEAHANGRSGIVHSSYLRYRKAGAYSTWFGKRMPVDFDFSVLCNVLYWVRANHLSLSAVDSATVDLIRDMVVRELPVKDPAYASPHYARTPVLLYHIGRLLGSFSIPALDTLKPLLIKEARTALTQAKDPMDRVLLSTTLLRLGASDVPPVSLDSLDEADPEFVFFIASFSDYFRNPFRRVFLHTRFIRYEFQCVAYNRFLLLEYLVLRKASTRPIHTGV